MNNFDFFCKTCTKGQAYREEHCITYEKVRIYKRGERIIYRGEMATSILMITKGRIRNETVLDSGVKLVAIEHQAPYPLGAVALFAPKNHFRIDSIAIEECEVAVISRAEIEDQISRCKIFMRNFIADNAKKVDVLSSHLSILSCRTIKSKVAFYIFSRAKGGRFTLGRTITDLAIYFCVERPSLSRAIKELVADGVIAIHRGEGEILKINELKSLLE